MSDVEKRKLKLDRMIEAVAKEQAKLLLAEREEQRKRRRAELKQREADRRADAHRKIELGGLVIAAGVDEWNENDVRLTRASWQNNQRVAALGTEEVKNSIHSLLLIVSKHYQPLPVAAVTGVETV